MSTIKHSLVDHSSLAVTAFGSTQPRSFAARASDVVNVKDFGAQGDGATDDTGSIQSALTAGAGKTVYFPSGTYIVAPASNSTWLGVASGTVIQGDGAGSVLRVKDSAGSYGFLLAASPTYSSHVENVTIRDIAIDQNPSGNVTNISVGDLTKSQLGIAFFDYKNVTIERVTFVAATGVNTIDLNAAGGSGAVVRDCSFTFKRSGSVDYDNSTIYIHGSQWMVSGNYFVDGSGANKAVTAIEVHGGPGTMTGNLSFGYYCGTNVVTVGSGPLSVSVAGNTFANAAAGIQLWALAGHVMSGVTVSGNIVSLNQADRATYTHLGICLYNGSGITGSFTGIVISGNEFRAQEESGRSYDAVDSGGILVNPQGAVSGLQVVGNTVRGFPSQGIRATPVGSLSASTISRNLIVNAGNDASVSQYNRVGLMISGTFTDVRVNDNDVFDTHSPASGYYAVEIPAPTVFTNVYLERNKSSAGLTNETLTSGVEVYPQSIHWFDTTGPTISIDASMGNWFMLQFASGNTGAKTIAAPANPISGQRITVVFQNQTGGSLGTMTWPSSQYGWKLATWASPDDGFTKSIDFVYSGFIWLETSRSNSIPN